MSEDNPTVIMKQAETAYGAVERLMEKTAFFQIVTVDNDPREAFYLVKGEQVIGPCLTMPPWRELTFRTPEQLLEYAISIKNELKIAYVGLTGIRFLPDRNEPRSFAFCPLSCQPFVERLNRGTGALTQKDFIRFLRFDLNGGIDGSLLTAVRQIKFRTGQEGETKIEHSRQSMSRSITETISGVNRIPEETIVTLPINVEYKSPSQIRCLIEMDAAAQSFSMRTFPNEFQRAADAVISSICQMFTMGEIETFACMS